MQAFVQELGDRLGKPVESFEQPQSAALSAQSERADMSAPMALPVSESVEQQKSAVFQAGKLGFTVGTFCCSKNSAKVAVFRVKSMSETDCEIVEVINGRDGECTLLDICQLLLAYRLHKGRVTSLLPGWDPKSQSPVGSPAASPTWELECARGAVALALREQFIKHKDCIFPYILYIYVYIYIHFFIKAAGGGGGGGGGGVGSGGDGCYIVCITYITWQQFCRSTKPPPSTVRYETGYETRYETADCNSILYWTIFYPA